jgi:hypothetical protein
MFSMIYENHFKDSNDFKYRITFQISNLSLLMSGICITGSAVGGSVETQECMDFFADKDIR